MIPPELFRANITGRLQAAIDSVVAIRALVDAQIIAGAITEASADGLTRHLRKCLLELAQGVAVVPLPGAEITEAEPTMPGGFAAEAART